MPSRRSDPGPRRALLGVSLGYFMVLFDTTALAVALPDISRDLGGGVEGLAWITDAYTLTFAACLLAGGVVADVRGADRTFAGGLVAFGVISLACAAAPTTWWLVAARACLGVAGALLVPASLSLIAALFRDPARRAAAIGSWASISGSALAAGPLVGGALVAALGWRAIFVVNVPVAVLAGHLLRGRLPAVQRREAQVVRGVQAGVLVAVAGLTWSLIRGGAEGWTGLDVVAGFVVAALATGVAVCAERSSARSTVPAALVRSPRFLGALIGGLVVGGALAGELFLTTLQLQQVRGFGPVLAGVAFLPLTVPMVLNPPLAARMVARVGPYAPVLTGFLLIAAAAAALAGTADAPYVLVAAALVLLGLGVSLTLPALTSAVVLAAPPEATGAAGGLFSVVRQTGATVGVAAAVAIVGSDLDHAGRGHALLAAAAGLAAITWVLLARPERGEARTRRVAAS